jgi:hypothetical protein
MGRNALDAFGSEYWAEVGSAAENKEHPVLVC